MSNESMLQSISELNLEFIFCTMIACIPVIYIHQLSLICFVAIFFPLK